MKKEISEKKKSNYNPIVPAVDQALELLNCLDRSSSSQLTLTQICDRLDLGKSKVFTILNTYIKHDFIEKDPQTKTYRLGLGIVYLARNILKNLNIRDIVQPHLKALAIETDLTAHFGQITGSRFYIIAREESNELIGYTMRVGVSHQLAHGAHGKAIVSSMGETERKQILSQASLGFYGDGEPVDMDRLERDFQACRKLGYAVDPGDTNPNITAISSPVFNGESNPIGAIVLIGAFDREKIKIFGPKVSREAISISRKLGYTPSMDRQGPAEEK